MVSDCPSLPGGLGRAAPANSRTRRPNRQASATIGGRKTDAGLDGAADQGRGGAARLQEQLGTVQAGDGAEMAPGAGEKEVDLATANQQSRAAAVGRRTRSAHSALSQGESQPRLGFSLAM